MASFDASSYFLDHHQEALLHWVDAQSKTADRYKRDETQAVAGDRNPDGEADAAAARNELVQLMNNITGKKTPDRIIPDGYGYESGGEVKYGELINPYAVRNEWEDAAVTRILNASTDRDELKPRIFNPYTEFTLQDFHYTEKGEPMIERDGFRYVFVKRKGKDILDAEVYQQDAGGIWIQKETIQDVIAKGKRGEKK